MLVREILAYRERKELTDRIMSKNLQEFKRMDNVKRMRRPFSPASGALTDQELYDMEQAELKKKDKEEFEARLNAVRK